LGIDLENILSTPLAKDRMPYIINNQEQQLLHNLSIPVVKSLTIIFSAKESVFKALYPQGIRYFDFTAVQISTLCTETKQLLMILTEDLSLQLPKRMPITGHYLQYHDQIFTCIIKCQEEW
jgi:enterobactin synthetase component D